MSRIPARVVSDVVDRAYVLGLGLCCEACGGPIGSLSYAFHHRHPRGRGGSKLPWIDTSPNLMLVHGDLRWNCHNLTEYSIHQCPARSYRLGHLVHQGVDPSTVRVLVARDLKELRA